MHVQKYKGFTLRNGVHYQSQMDVIDDGLCITSNKQYIQKWLDNMKPLVPQTKKPSFNETMDYLDCCKAIQETKPGGQWIGCPVPTRNDDMYVSQDVTVTEKNDTSQTRSYFLARVKDIHYEKEAAALKTYGFVGEDRYLSPNDLVERIKAGTFTIESDDADEPSYCPLEAFLWTTVKKDSKGLTAYKAALNDLTVQTKDAIWAETDFSKLPGLVAAFKAATVTPVTLN